jgi:Peptidase C10 family/Spi protease inhibitor
MKKTNLFFAAFIMAVGILLFAGCQKNKNNAALDAEETNVQIVPENVAIDIAEHFNPATFFNENNGSNYSSIKSTLTGQNKIKEKFMFNDSYGKTALYIFNFEDNGGFLFVSGDYSLQPILAYIERGAFKKDTVPSGLVNWINKTMENIETVRKGLYDNAKVAGVAWRQYYKQNGITGIDAYYPIPIEDGCTEDTWTTTSVGPLLPTTWGQGCTYNDLCPNLSCNISCGTARAWTGCVATAAAQVVRYWHPTNSFGYDYNSMPTASGNNDVQRLMRDMGSNISMNYGCSGSGTQASNVPNALKNQFGLSSANYVSYSYSRVESNLNAHWPVLLDGCSTRTSHWFIFNWYYTYSDCHEWVCDGYNRYSVTYCNNGQVSGGASYLYFHMNWGWHEAWGGNDFNGWFAFDNWNIPGAGFNFQYCKGLTSEIHP